MTRGWASPMALLGPLGGALGVHSLKALWKVPLDKTTSFLGPGRKCSGLCARQTRIRFGFSAPHMTQANSEPQAQSPKQNRVLPPAKKILFNKR